MLLQTYSFSLASPVLNIYLHLYLFYCLLWGIFSHVAPWSSFLNPLICLHKYYVSRLDSFLLPHMFIATCQSLFYIYFQNMKHHVSAYLYVMYYLFIICQPHKNANIQTCIPTSKYYMQINIRPFVDLALGANEHKDYTVASIIF